MKISRQTKNQLKLVLAEDVGNLDATTKLVVPRSMRAQAVVVAKEPGVFCGRQVVLELIKIVDSRLKVKWSVKDREVFRRQKELFSLQGKLPSILKIERVLLNLIAHLSGVATTTSQFVKLVKRKKVRILDTRKTTPLWRELEKYAVKVGGGYNHRFGLYDEVFVKENHKRFGNLEALKKIPRKFVIEVCDHEELVEALYFKPRVILFDNFKPVNLKREVLFARKKDKKVILEASGGITLKNIQAYARTGIQQISIGSLTHSVKAIDFSMLVQ